MREREVANEAETKRLRREAHSIEARGRRSEAWAANFVLGEPGEILETAERRLVAKAARLLDTGLVDRQSALRSAVDLELHAVAAPYSLSTLCASAHSALCVVCTQW